MSPLISPKVVPDATRWNLLDLLAGGATNILAPEICDLWLDPNLHDA